MSELKICQKECQKECQKKCHRLTSTKTMDEEERIELKRPKGSRFHQSFPLLLVLARFYHKECQNMGQKVLELRCQFWTCSIFWKVYQLTHGILAFLRRWCNNMMSRWGSLEVRIFLCVVALFLQHFGLTFKFCPECSAFWISVFLFCSDFQHLGLHFLHFAWYCFRLEARCFHSTWDLQRFGILSSSCIAFGFFLIVLSVAAAVDNDNANLLLMLLLMFFFGLCYKCALSRLLLQCCGCCCWYWPLLFWWRLPSFGCWVGWLTRSRKHKRKEAAKQRMRD